MTNVKLTARPSEVKNHDFNIYYNGATANDCLAGAVDENFFPFQNNQYNNDYLFEIDKPAVVNRVIVYEIVEKDLWCGIQNQEFSLFYQPIVNLTTGVIKGVEALTRWQHPYRGMISPSKFIPIAEKSKLINPLGNWILYQACLSAASWQSKFPEHNLYVSVNVAPQQLREKDFLSNLIVTLENTNCHPNNLILEITESEEMAEIDLAKSMLKEISNLGVRLSLDDFGTGYSSLMRLCELPFNIIKIDRSFIMNMAESKQHKLVKMMINLANNLGLEVVAEGVETQEQVRLLKQEKCHLAQGYFFSKPLNIVDTEKTILAIR